MDVYGAEFTVAELRERAGEEAFHSAGAHIAAMDGPHEDDWSLYTTITLDDGRELETILHHRAGKPLSGDCTCDEDSGDEKSGTGLCSHLVWVGLTHLGLDGRPAAALAAESASTGDLVPWLTTLAPNQLIELVLEAAADDRDYRRRLHQRA